MQFLYDPIYFTHYLESELFSPQMILSKVNIRS